MQAFHPLLFSMIRRSSPAVLYFSVCRRLRGGARGDARNLFEGMSTRLLFSSESTTLAVLPYRYAFRSTPVDNELHSHTSRKALNFLMPSNKKLLLQLPELGSRSFVRLLSLAIKLSDILFGKQLHCLMLKCGLCSDVFVGSALVSTYSKCRSVEAARVVFDDLPVKDLVLWNAMVSCYASNGLAIEAFKLFEIMRSQGCREDGFTLSSLLNGCSSSGCYDGGRQTHCLVAKSGLASDVAVGCALVDMYVKCDHIKQARQVFDTMGVRNVICWNAIIVGYAKDGDCKEAMKLFADMLLGGTRPDKCTLSSVLSSCANMAASNETIQVHGYLVKSGYQSFISIGNALIMAYAKSGCICNATQVFQSIHKPDLVSWSSITYSFAFHGLATEAIYWFQAMLHEGVTPDGIAFLGVLFACSHAGLVQTGFHYFSSMIKDYQIKPSSEHFTCLIDLLGRAGHLEQAYNLLVNIPFEYDENVLGAFLGACKAHKNASLAEWAADILFSIEPDKAVNYVQLSNIYVAVGCWEEVGSVRRMIRDRCGKKVPGCSWIEICGKVHTFVSDDRAHVEASNLYDMLEILFRAIIDKENYVSDLLFLDGDIQHSSYVF